MTLTRCAVALAAAAMLSLAACGGGGGGKPAHVATQDEAPAEAERQDEAAKVKARADIRAAEAAVAQAERRRRSAEHDRIAEEAVNSPLAEALGQKVDTSALLERARALEAEADEALARAKRRLAEAKAALEHAERDRADPVTTAPDPVIPGVMRTLANPAALDPLPAFRSVELPDATSERPFRYSREIPARPAVEIRSHIRSGPTDIVPMMRRAAHVWTRRIIGVKKTYSHAVHDEPGVGGWFRVDLRDGACVSGRGTACSSHTGRFVEITPLGRRAMGTHSLTTTGFGFLAHEFGHIVAHFDPSNSDDPAHSSCEGGSLMCKAQGEPITMVPVEQDFDNIRHHYDLTDHVSDHETFGIWAALPGAGLRGFGVEVTRTLSVSERSGAWDNLARDYIKDTLNIAASVDGTMSDGPSKGLRGTATWNGDLIAVDTTRLHPVLGDAQLTMELSRLARLRADFSGLHRTDGEGMRHREADLGYDLTRQGKVWLDASGSATAGFYASDGDPAGAVAGTLDDRDRALIGAFGALRDF